MTDWPTRVILAGVDQPLAEVLADTVIRHGRGDVFDPPIASSCQLTFLGVTRAESKPFRIGGALQVIATIAGVGNVPRFTGDITDAALEDDRLTVVAVGRLARLSRYLIGAGAWPAETWSARVTRAFTEAGLASLLTLQVGGFNPQLAARPGAAITLADYLLLLSVDVGAAIVDTPDGHVLVQATDARTTAGALTVDPHDVRYTPAWTQSPTVVNQVTVEYDGGTVTASDSSSAGLYGPVPETLTTELDFDTDAQLRANQYLARRAYARWQLPATDLLEAYPVSVGTAVQLSALPASAPYPAYAPVVEGWAEQINGPDWTMQLALSDPLISGLVLTWAQVPVTAAYRWNTIDQTVPWRDAITLDDLLPTVLELEEAA